MRLWHRSLVPFLPRQQLVAQYREWSKIYNQFKDFTPLWDGEELD